MLYCSHRTYVSKLSAELRNSGSGTVSLLLLLFLGAIFPHLFSKPLGRVELAIWLVCETTHLFAACEIST